jgi:hypothetical protein
MVSHLNGTWMSSQWSRRPITANSAPFRHFFDDVFRYCSFQMVVFFGSNCTGGFAVICRVLKSVEAGKTTQNRRRIDRRRGFCVVEKNPELISLVGE